MYFQDFDELEELLASGLPSQKLLQSVRRIHQRTKSALERFKVVFDRANFGMAIATLDGTIQYINPYYAEIHGYRPEEVIGKNILLFYSKEQ